MPLSNEGRPIPGNKSTEVHNNVIVSMPLSNEGRPILQQQWWKWQKYSCLDAPIQWRKANSMAKFVTTQYNKGLDAPIQWRKANSSPMATPSKFFSLCLDAPIQWRKANSITPGGHAKARPLFVSMPLSNEGRPIRKLWKDRILFRWSRCPYPMKEGQFDK